MKFSMKSIAAAVALATVAVSANAAINQGQNGNGALYFTAWDGVTSYYFDTNFQLDDYVADKSAAGNFSLSYGSASAFSSFASWVSSAAGPVKWTVQALDNQGDRRALTTMADSVTPVVKANDVLRSAISTALTNVNTANAAIDPTGSITGAGGIDAGVVSTNVAGSAHSNWSKNIGFNAFGTLSDNTYATGQSLMFIDAKASGTAKGIYTPQFDNGLAVKAWVAGNDVDGYTLNVAAVPEPETYAMLLAGLGLMGAVARRRQK